jgi:TRAP-type mannitol/chloroaromatic compound transport system permease small subunit
MSAVDSGIVTSIDNLIISVSFVMLVLTGIASVMTQLTREQEAIHGAREQDRREGP